jgi:hypothetical protein
MIGLSCGYWLLMTLVRVLMLFNLFLNLLSFGLLITMRITWVGRKRHLFFDFRDWSTEIFLEYSYKVLNAKMPFCVNENFPKFCFHF